MILSSEGVVAKKKKPVSRQIPAVRDLSVLLKDSPAGAWVALSPDEKRIVGTGASMQAAALQAQLNGEQNPVLVRTPLPEEAVGRWSTIKAACDFHTRNFFPTLRRARISILEDSGLVAGFLLLNA